MKERDKKEERGGRRRGGGSYCMNSPQLSRKVRGAKRMKMPREAVSNLSGKERKIVYFLKTVVVIDQVYCRLLYT